MYETEEKSLSETREPVMLLFVGIVILLLSFFVVMNHSASIETKRAQAVTRGIVTTFDPHSRAAGRFSSNLGESPVDAAQYEKIGNLVATVFPLARVSVLEPGRMFLIELPLGYMWIDDEVAPTDSGRKFIGALATLLAEPQAGLSYDVDARLLAEPETSRTLAIARIATFGDILEAAGVPPGSVATGVDADTVDRLRMILTAHEASDGRG
jgi:hypothetical protein